MLLLKLLILSIQSYISTQQSCGRFPVEFNDILNASYIIGGIFPVHYYSSDAKGYVYNNAGLMWIEAMQFALEEINNSTTLLPGIKLGYKIYDSCNNINLAVESALQLTQGFDKYELNMTCPCHQHQTAIGIVGDAASATTTRVAAIVSASKTPQISYSATSTDLSAKHLYPSFLRTIPPDNFQALLITDLMRRFQWKYVNVIACDDNYGRVGVTELLPQLKRFNICVAVNEVYDVKNDNNNTYTTEVIQKLKKESEATVIVLWCQPPEAMKVLQEAERLMLYHRTWIATESYGQSDEVYKINHNVVKGMFGVIPAQLSYKPFEDRLKTITPNNSDENPWLEEHWVVKRKCVKQGDRNFTCIYPSAKPYDLSTLPRNKYVNVMDSVYAIAHGLDKYLEKIKPKDDYVDPRVLLQFVRNVSFTGKSYTTVSFDKLGNPGDATYSVTNLYYNSTTDSLLHSKVGLWNFVNRNVTFANKLQFANNSDSSPRSSCAELCSPGYKGLTFGDRPCCWKCVACPPQQIQPLPGQSFCSPCTGENLSNHNQTKCIKPMIQYLRPSTTSGALLIALMVVGYIIIIGSIVIAFINRTTPMVKAANKSLSLLQMISMLLILAFPLLFFVAKPTVLLCGVRLYYFVCFNSIAVSVTFTKADRLLRIFKASKSGILAKRSNVKGNKLQFLTVAILTIVALVLCTVIYIPFRPVIDKEINKSNNDHDIHVWYYCSGYNDSILFILIGYIAMIALICGVYAFKARKLPETYNEARYTSFAMFTFLLIWMMFVPIYFSTQSKVDQISTWCFISFASIFVIYATMYFPKVFIILFKPEENTIEKFRERMNKGTIAEKSQHSTDISNEDNRKYVNKYTVSDS